MIWYAKLQYARGRMVLGRALHSDPSCKWFAMNERHLVHKISGSIVDHMPKCKFCTQGVVVSSKDMTIVEAWGRALRFVQELNNCRNGADIRLTASMRKELAELVRAAAIHG